MREKKMPFSAVLCSKKNGPEKKRKGENEWTDAPNYDTAPRVDYGSGQSEGAIRHDAALLLKKSEDVDREKRKMQIIGPYSVLYVFDFFTTL